MTKEEIKIMSDSITRMSEREALQAIVKLLLELLKKGK